MHHFYSFVNIDYSKTSKHLLAHLPTLCVCWRRCIPWPTRCETISCRVRRLRKHRSFHGLPRTSARRMKQVVRQMKYVCKQQQQLECLLHLLVVMADRPLPIGGCRQCDLLLVFRLFVLGLCSCVLFCVFCTACECGVRGRVFSHISVSVSVCLSLFVWR